MANVPARFQIVTFPRSQRQDLLGQGCDIVTVSVPLSDKMTFRGKMLIHRYSVKTVAHQIKH